MGKKSKISWTDHTFNTHWGCVKISEGCENCYAETLSNRFGDLWGVNAKRRFFGDKHWNEPLKWNKWYWYECEGCHTRGRFISPEVRPGDSFLCPDCRCVCNQVRQKVFCGSMCDILEIHQDPAINAMLDNARHRLFDLIFDTPNLDWLLLTKRPENWRILTESYSNGTKFPWDNIWMGVTTENQEQADKRIPELLKIPARVRFLSVEPMLGSVDLANIGGNKYGHGRIDTLRGLFFNDYEETKDRKRIVSKPSKVNKIDWVICGGESGNNARPMRPDWARSLRDQCKKAGIPFFMKQMSGKNKSDRENIPDGLQIQEFPDD